MLKRTLMFAAILTLSVAARAGQPGIIHWSPESTGRAVVYEVALAERTTTTSLILTSWDVPATQTLTATMAANLVALDKSAGAAAGKVWFSFTLPAEVSGKVLEFLVRGRSRWGAVGAWSLPYTVDLSAPPAPRNLKAQPLPAKTAERAQ
jgi:hypothetical protein